MMEGFTAHRIRFECEALDPLAFQREKGSALRGAFFRALWDAFCANKAAPTCPDCHLVHTCPVAFLVATMDDGAPRQGARGGRERRSGDRSERAKASPSGVHHMDAPLTRYLRALPTGGQLPRPYTIEPPLDRRERYEPGERIAFGLTLFGRALHLFPYVVLAVQQWERTGIGLPLPENRGRRGRVLLREAWAEHPLTGERRRVLQRGEQLVHVPDLPVTHEDVLHAAWQPRTTATTAVTAGAIREARQAGSDPAGCGGNGAPAAAALAVRRMVLCFLTPARLVDHGHPVSAPHLRVLVQRLLERLTVLSRTFGRPVEGQICDGFLDDGGDGLMQGSRDESRPAKGPAPTRERVQELLALADAARLVDDRTTWVDAWSHSARTGRASPIGGFAGAAVYEADGDVDLGPLLPWLLWGQVVHVGKDTVKGNGWYEVRCVD